MPHDNGATKSPHCSCGEAYPFVEQQRETSDGHKYVLLSCPRCGRVTGTVSVAKS